MIQMNKNITDSIVYIGASTRDIDLFENQYIVPEGMAYNSYIIFDEKIAVMDTADACVSDEWRKNLEDALDGKTPDYLVVSHLEPDHAANIAYFAEKYPSAKLVGNAKTFAMLPQFFDMDFSDRQVVVTDGGELSLGAHTLIFTMAPMVHWPEVMLSYEKSEKVLFSADGFGKFGVIDADEDWDCEARRYYFNILGKYGMQVQNLLKKLAPFEIETICPLHGPILTENLAHYIGKYDTWSKYEPENKGVTIAYASIHGNTAAAAKQLAQMLKANGEEKVSLFDLSRDDMAEAIEDAFRYDALVLAASSYDGGVFPPMEDFLAHLKAKTYRNRTVAIMENGSWALSAGRCIRAVIETLKDIKICENVVSIKSVVKPDTVAAMQALANEITSR